MGLDRPESRSELKPVMEKLSKFRFTTDPKLNVSTQLILQAYSEYTNGRHLSAADKLMEAKKHSWVAIYQEREEYSLDIATIRILHEAGEIDRAIKLAYADMLRATSEGHRITNYRCMQLWPTSMKSRDRRIPSRNTIINTSNSYSGLNPEEYPNMPSPWADVFFNGDEYVKGLTFDDVVVSASSFDGIGGSLPSDIRAGETYEHCYTFPLTDAHRHRIENLTGGNLGKLRVVAIITDSRTGKFVNYNKSLHLDSIGAVKTTKWLKEMS